MPQSIEPVPFRKLRDITPASRFGVGGTDLGIPCRVGNEVLYVFGDTGQRRKVYYYASVAKVKLPIFRIGNVICARKSKLLDWIEQQEAAR